MEFSILEISLLIILSDLVLMFLVDMIFSRSVDKLTLFQNIRSKSERFQERMKGHRLSTALISLGWLGPLTITAIPFAGGVWSGMALSRIMGLSHKKTLFAVSLGAVIGCLIFALAALGVLSIIDFSTE